MLDWLNGMIPTLVSPTFTAIVNVISIIGFVITIFVMVGVRQIKGHYTSRIRVPELRNQLVAHASKIGDFLNDYSNNRNSISLEMAATEPVLRAIKKRLSWSERGKINEALKKINKLQKEPSQSEKDVRLIYNILHGLSSELEQWENDKKWST